MKKALYIILLVVEAIAGFIMLTLVTSVSGWIFFSSITLLWAILSILFIVKINKSADDRAKRKLKIGLPFIMLIPLVAAFLYLLGFAIAFMAVI